MFSVDVLRCEPPHFSYFAVGPYAWPSRTRTCLNYYKTRDALKQSLTIQSRPTSDRFQEGEEMQLFRGMARLVVSFTPDKRAATWTQVLKFLLVIKKSTKLDVACFVTAFAYLHFWMGGSRHLHPLLYNERSSVSYTRSLTVSDWKLVLVTALCISQKYIEDDR